MGNNCERHLTRTWGKGKQIRRIHQTFPEISSFQKELWWYGLSFDDGYLYQPEQRRTIPGFSLLDHDQEWDLH